LYRYTADKLDPYSLQQIRNEIALHSSVFHPAITSFYGWFEDERGNIYLMLELASRGDAFNLLYGEASSAAPGLAGEADICERVIVPTASAVAHLHARDIVHRDIKPENLMICDHGLTCKLADFGFAVDTRTHRTVTRLGTLEYMAPEIMVCTPDVRDTLRAQGTPGYGKEVDCWAIGILAYECLAGRSPYDVGISQMTMPDMLVMIETGDLDTELRSVPDVSQEARHFVKSCLATDPAERLTAAQMLSHPWITKHG
jgi:serine/threonine protein kinase